MKRKDKTSLYRLLVILVVGAFGFLGVHVFGQYVDSLSDLPVGPTPLSWKFKSNSSLVSQTFNKKEFEVSRNTLEKTEVPEIDKTNYPVTETALFALG